jgi:hypothetical protein
MEAICSSETWVHVRTTRRYIPEDDVIYLHTHFNPGFQCEQYQTCLLLSVNVNRCRSYCIGDWEEGTAHIIVMINQSETKRITVTFRWTFRELLRRTVKTIRQPSPAFPCALHNIADLWGFVNDYCRSRWSVSLNHELSSPPSNTGVVGSNTNWGIDIFVYCKIWEFNGSDYEECRLLGCYTVWFL